MKKTDIEGYRVVVETHKNTAYIYREIPADEQLTACNEIASQIKRHVDDVANVYVEAEENNYC